MAELGRARPVILAFIATILTANIAILSADRAQAERAIAATLTSTTRVVAPPKQHFVLFGKTDTPVAIPTAFAVRGDGTELTPASPSGSPATPASTARGAWSHDGEMLAAIRKGDAGDDLWLVRRSGGDPRQLTHFAAVDASFCGRNGVAQTQLGRPMWSPDDRYIAFLSNANHLATFGVSFDIEVVDVDGGNVVTAYQAPRDTCQRVDSSTNVILPAEFLSLFGWSKSANMAA
ncbi:MAG: Dipeptidyl peptidase N-terminal region [Actinomycetota bacterium]|jgi:hypothetical protein